MTKEEIKSAAAALYESFTLPVFRALNEMPEPSRAEWHTSAYLRKQCQALGVDYRLARTDGLTVFASVTGTRASGKPLCIGYKCDMDAIRRESSDGYFHGCFHSGHMAIALSVMKFLHAHPEAFSFRLIFIFQSAEEVIGPSGAERLVDTAEFQQLGLDYLVGMHASPELPLGQVGFREGIAQASVDELKIEVLSPRAAHVQYQQIANPIFVLSEIIGSLQKLSAQGDPMRPTLLNWVKCWTSNDPSAVNANKVPSVATAVASFRVFDEVHREACKERISKICQGVEAMYTDLVINPSFAGNGIKSVRNHPALTARLRAAATAYLGEQAVVDAAVRMGGDDFSYYSHLIPSCLFRLGVTRSPDQGFKGLHDEAFAPDPAAMETGVGSMLYMLLCGDWTDV